jgi:mediator of RNA polymerase II transcription subunit 16
LKRDSKTSKWSLSEPSIVTPEPNDHNVIIHISWSPLGNEMAVTDDTGRVKIYRTHPISGRMRLQYSSQSNDVTNDLKAIAGLFWLSVEPHVRMVCNLIVLH